MIIWNGLGFLVALFVFGSALLLNFLLNAVMGSGYYESHSWPVALALLIAATLSWVVGQRLNNAQGRTMTDKATGQEVVLKATHRLFFIPMQWWGAILAVGAVLALIFK